MVSVRRIGATLSRADNIRRRAMHTPLSVVLATYNRRPILERTLDALARQTQAGFRVVVVDDGSTDDTWERLEARAGGDPGLEIIRQENRGQGPARNRALERVDSRLVLFLGDDIVPGEDFIAEHLAAHDDGEPRAVVGFTDWYHGEMKVTPALEMAGREGHQFGYGHMTPGEEVPFTCFYTSNISLPRQELGPDPFDDAFSGYGWEDVELGYRLSRRGLGIVYHPAAAARHLHPMDLRTLFERQRTVGRGVHTLLELHPELAASEHLAPPEPPRWFPVGRHLVPPLVPWLAAVDSLRVPLSEALLHRVLMCAYYLGREEGRPPVAARHGGEP